jgi:hypothetical protein
LYRGKKCAISILSLENGTIYLKEYLTDIRWWNFYEKFMVQSMLKRSLQKKLF